MWAPCAPGWSEINDEFKLLDMVELSLFWYDTYRYKRFSQMFTAKNVQITVNEILKRKKTTQNPEMSFWLK